VKTPLPFPSIVVLCVTLFGPTAFSLPIELNWAGPASWAVLQLGIGQVTTLNAGSVLTGITGNVGVNQQGQLRLSPSALISGNVLLGSGASLPSAASAINGTVSTNDPLLVQAHNDAVAASGAAAALGSLGGGIDISSISSGGNLTPGVYNLTSLNLTNESLRLAAGGSYVFNISGTLALHGSSSILLDAGLSEADVLFNITGAKDVSISGGGAGSVLHGIVLALQSRVNLAPGLVVGEIISGNSINLASGASVQAVKIQPVLVPDSGTTLLCLGLSLLAIAAMRHAAQFRVRSAASKQ
jgi:Ice-binding-like/VPDSG-CTERM motif